jgi:hypothetical protein
MRRYNCAIGIPILDHKCKTADLANPVIKVAAHTQVGKSGDAKATEAAMHSTACIA